jgi:hypothetical protein
MIYVRVLFKESTHDRALSVWRACLAPMTAYEIISIFIGILALLVMNCSPVRNGATAQIVNIVTVCLEKKHDVKNICIDDYDIKFCKGCGTCHNTAKCVQNDDADRIIEQYEWADIVISVSPSYWADIPGQFKAFIDRCTPWCNTHEPHAKISSGKKGYAIALRTGTGYGRM